MKYIKTYEEIQLNRIKSKREPIKNANRQLLDACFFGDQDLIEDDIRRGADPNTKDKENFDVLPIEYAIGNRRRFESDKVFFKMLDLLIDNGADVNLCGEKEGGLLFNLDMNMDLLLYLIKRGVDINKSTFGGKKFCDIITREDKGAFALLNNKNYNSLENQKKLLKIKPECSLLLKRSGILDNSLEDKYKKYIDLDQLGIL